MRALQEMYETGASILTNMAANRERLKVGRAHMHACMHAGMCMCGGCPSVCVCVCV